MSKLVLLDRDGIINRDSVHYIRSVEEFVPVDGSLAAIARLTRAGYRIGVATNQSGVARGLYSEDELKAINDTMCRLVQEAGGEISAVEYCPHMPDSHCPCRKPAPGMLLKLAKRLDSSLVGVPFVGDRVSDIQAALAAGATPVMVLSSMTDRAALLAWPEVPVFQSLSDWVDVFLEQSCSKP